MNKTLILGFSPWSSSDKCHPFDAIFPVQASLIDRAVKDCDAIVLWGGTDINPEFYKQEAHPLTWFNVGSTRDKMEWKWMHDAFEHGVPIIGVCRGAQLICAGVGGSLFQHVTGHQGAHAMTTKEGRVYQTSSAHHQMLNLSALDPESYEVLAVSTQNRSKRYEDASGVVETGASFKEPEVVLFPNVRALAVQGHPEWHDLNDPFNQYILDLVRLLMVKEKENV